jgi:hypothetical protein
MEPNSCLNRTVGKKEFEEFLESHRNQLRNKTAVVRESCEDSEAKVEERRC